MKKLLFLVAFFAVCSLVGLTTSSCSDKGRTAEAPDTLESEDSIDRMEREFPMPKAADRLFGDFLYNFMTRRDVQYERINFPLKETTGPMSKIIERADWKRERFFSNQYFYTLLFDSVEQEELQNDTSVNHAVVEKIYLERKSIKQYVFERVRGVWMLMRIENIALESSPNASFLEFYNRFVTDSAFQSRSLHENLMFSGPDPDDDLSNIEGVLMPEQFPSFAPPMPHGMMYNILYGEGNRDSDTKIMLIEGISNGNESELVFKRRRGRWQLCKITM